MTAPADTPWVTEGTKSERTCHGAWCLVRSAVWERRAGKATVVEWCASVYLPGVGTLRFLAHKSEADARAWCERWARVLAREVTRG